MRRLWVTALVGLSFLSVISSASAQRGGVTTATTSGSMIVEAMASATAAFVVAGTMTMTMMMIGHVNAAAATIMATVTSGVADTMKIRIASPVAGTTLMTGNGSVIVGPRRSLRLSSTKTSTCVAIRMLPEPWNKGKCGLGIPITRHSGAVRGAASAAQ